PSRLDDVLDAIDAVAADLVVYRVGEPTSECRAFADVIVDAVADTEQAIKCLRRLDPGFHAIAVAVNTLENRADQLLRQSLAALFDKAPDAMAVLGPEQQQSLCRQEEEFKSRLVRNRPVERKGEYENSRTTALLYSSNVEAPSTLRRRSLPLRTRSHRRASLGAHRGPPGAC